MESLRTGLDRLRRRRVGRLVADLVGERLTPAGRALALLWVLAAVLGASNLNAPIYRVWAFATAALAVAVVAARRALPELALGRLPPGHTSAGAVLEVEVEVENRSSRVARDVAVLERDLPAPVRPAERLPAALARLAPGERAVLTVRLRCPRRGAYTLRALHAASAHPLGLWRSLLRYPGEAPFLVYPAFRTPTSFPVPHGRNYQPGGFLLSSSVGESSEFMHTRDYRTGDNPRHVHWASTARVGHPVVKVYHEEYFVRLALVVDTEVARDPVAVGGDGRAFEAAISIAAGIADHLSRREYIIDLFAAGAAVYHFQAGRALAHFEHILEILACIDGVPAVDWEALAQAILPEAPRLTGVVALFQDWTAERATLVSELEARGVGVRVLVVRDGPTTLEAPALPQEAYQQLRSDQDLPDTAALGAGEGA